MAKHFVQKFNAFLGIGHGFASKTFLFNSQFFFKFDIFSSFTSLPQLKVEYQMIFSNSFQNKFAC